MEYKIGAKERLVLGGILPPEGNLATLRIVRELREALSFSEVEHGDLNLRDNPDGPGMIWDPIPDKTIEIGAKGQGLVREALKKLDTEATMTADHLDLCDMFEYEGE